jgi:hypothetical protein
MDYEQEADRIAMEGHDAGAALWQAIDIAMNVGMSARKARRLFDALIDDIADELSGTEADLFRTSAYEALPISATSTVERAEIDANAWRAWEVFVGDARAAEAEAIADYRRDQRRDERVSE